MPDAAPQSLIDQMDPDANYGSRTYRKAVREASVGLLMLSPGPGAGTQPIIRDAATGLAVTGSASPNGAVPWEQQFEDRGEQDFSKVYEALIEKATGSKDGKPDTKAIIYYLDRMMGRPKEMVSHGLDKKTEKLFEKMGRSEEVVLTLAPGVTVIEPDPQ